MKDGENAPWKIFLFMCKHLKVSYNAFVYLKAQRAERNQYFFIFLLIILRLALLEIIYNKTLQ